MREFELRLRAELPQFRLVAITAGNAWDVLALYLSNPVFFSLTQSHTPRLSECLEDITALPPGARMEQKYFLGLYQGETCVAVLDFIVGWPDVSTGFLGLLIVDGVCHRAGIGGMVVNAVARTAVGIGLTRLELSCHTVNYGGFTFWTQHGFCEIRRTELETDGVKYSMIRMGKRLEYGQEIPGKHMDQGASTARLLLGGSACGALSDGGGAADLPQ